MAGRDARTGLHGDLAARVAVDLGWLPISSAAAVMAYCGGHAAAVQDGRRAYLAPLWVSQ